MRRHVFASLALLAGLGLSGCYWIYCDDDGGGHAAPSLCGNPGDQYQLGDGTTVTCDGMGCVACRPGDLCYTCWDDGVQCYCDEPLTCLADQDCPEGAYCKESWNECVASSQCTRDEDCPLDMVCDQTRETCRPGERPHPQTCQDNGDCDVGQFCNANHQCQDSQTCQTHADCTLPGLGYCDERGTCVPSPAPSCRTAEDCSEGQRCIDGFCSDWNGSQGQCQFDEQCDGGNGLCVNGQCHSACTANEDCGTGEICDGGFCRFAEDPQGGCRFNADCPDGQVCIDTVCHATGCTQDSDCANASDTCVDGVCVANEDPKPECTQNADCQEAGYECVEGVCRKACTVADPDCTSCGMSYCIRGYCYDAEPECMLPSDCPNGEDCIDAKCVAQ